MNESFLPSHWTLWIYCLCNDGYSPFLPAGVLLLCRNICYAVIEPLCAHQSDDQPNGHRLSICVCLDKSGLNIKKNSLSQLLKIETRKMQKLNSGAGNRVGPQSDPEHCVWELVLMSECLQRGKTQNLYTHTDTVCVHVTSHSFSSSTRHYQLNSDQQPLQTSCVLSVMDGLFNWPTGHVPRGLRGQRLLYEVSGCRLLFSLKLKGLS